MDIPTTEPTKLRAGDTWKWRREDLSADYPAGTWTLKYRFKNATGGFEITATADGVNFAVTVTAATSGAYAAGEYAWQAWVENGSEKYTVRTGTLDVLPDLRAGTATAALDTRSMARKLLDAVEAVLANTATLDQQAYTIHGRSLTRIPRGELLEIRSKLKAEVAGEQRAEKLRKGLGGDNRIVVRL